jgi:hypothetical protein
MIFRHRQGTRSFLRGPVQHRQLGLRRGLRAASVARRTAPSRAACADSGDEVDGPISTRKRVGGLRNEQVDKQKVSKINMLFLNRSPPEGLPIAKVHIALQWQFRNIRNWQTP